ncbi:MAG: M23 family metallopeptidase [bacterium]|nr:M23 family metallopeptidase [bacterium]
MKTFPLFSAPSRGAAASAFVLCAFVSASPSRAQTPDKFPFYPVAGNLYEDLFPSQYVDVTPPGPPGGDWNCTLMALDGNTELRTRIRTYGEQEIGVPVFAVLDGTVVAVLDGEPDMTDNSPGCTTTGNYVHIDHGFGRECKYLRLKNGSIHLSVGDTVKAGQQLGLVGSSSCRRGPFLGFETYDNSVLIEPYAGLCRAGPSEWVNQPPINTDPFVHYFNIATAPPPGYRGWPHDRPRTGTLVQGSQSFYIFFALGTLPFYSDWELRWIRPNGTLGHSESGSFGPNFWLYLQGSEDFGVNLDMTGAWTLEVDINSTTVQQLPFEVVATPGGIVNRPPNPITVQITPECPSTDDVLICRVQNDDPVLDDPDYDIVRYQYVWKVGTTVVRNVTTAARSDVVPRRSLGDYVTCEVTASDGTHSAPTVQAAINVGVNGTAYCSPATPNSTSMAGTILASGCQVVSHNDFTLTADQLPPSEFGHFLAGQTQGFNNPPGSQGIICLSGNIGRFNSPSQIIQGPTGSIQVDLTSIPVNPPIAVLPGDTWHFQCWFRDNNPGQTSNFTDAVSVTFL